MLVMHRFIGMVVLAAALAAPLAISAAAAPQVSVQFRAYDRDHRDYHDWDGRENHRWGIYLNNNHRRYHEYRRSHRHEQSDYWRWRHEHGDRD